MTNIWLSEITEEILEGDCLEVLPEIPRRMGRGVDLFVTSPPYNLQGKVKYHTIADEEKVDDYFVWSEKWLKACREVAKPTGRLCLNVPIDVATPMVMPFGAYMLQSAEDAGWFYRTTIIWQNGHRSNNLARGSFNSPTSPYVYSGAELVLVFAADPGKWGLRKRGRLTDMLPFEFKDYTTGLWTFSGESRKRYDHPAPFPEEMARRCIKLFTFPGPDTLVVDPFSGSGTVAAVAKNLWRTAVGIDVDPKYCAVAAQRVDRTERATNREAYRRVGESWPGLSRTE